MKTNHQPHTHMPEPGWQMLGDLQLPAGGIPADAIQAWLTNVLAPFNLSQDFLNRVLQSAQESALRELEQNGSNPQGHIHFSVFTPYEQTASQKPWGFFHTERTENGSGSDVPRVHRINYYLYVEGE